MAVSVPVKYFNTFIIKNNSQDTDQWHIEESRIDGGFNKTTVDLGVRAYVVEEDANRQKRGNALIFSGVINSRTGKNDSNQFSIGEAITKALDSSNGSIQRLFAEDTNLTVFQEDKVSRALIDKDAIFSAEGSSITTSSSEFIGEFSSYAGEYGMSVDPGSFAFFGNRKYFTDKKRGLVLRLSQDGITEISNYGMRDYFLSNLNNRSLITGAYDVVNDIYILSTNNRTESVGRQRFTPYTVSFNETTNGWVSFFDYSPDISFSLSDGFYSVKNGKLWRHYVGDSSVGGLQYNSFFGIAVESNITTIFNPNPSNVKTFLNISYEGTESWDVPIINTKEDVASNIYNVIDGTYYEDGYVRHAGFSKSEDKYFACIKSISDIKPGEVIPSSNISGIKGFFATVMMRTSSNTYQELFSVNVNYNPHYN